MSSQRCTTAVAFGGLLVSVCAIGTFAIAQDKQRDIDISRARYLIERLRSGDTLTAEEHDYVERAKELRQRRRTRVGATQGKTSVGLVPLTDMGEDVTHQGEGGGLYGEGQNQPPPFLRKAAELELSNIVPRNTSGDPASDGRIVLISISMSNATQEFSAFKRLADADPSKSSKLTVVDCAQGGQAMSQWANPQARVWSEAERRLTAAGVSTNQVQVAWVKLANKMPRGGLNEHGRRLYDDTLQVLSNARRRYPNLRIVYLSSRTYGGYATMPLNPEPYAYESAFVARWLIQDQLNSESSLSWNAEQSEAKVPLLLWGPYLWADGTQGRKIDGLVWERQDYTGDGTHPSRTGRDKVARLLLGFFKQNPLAKAWFVGNFSTDRLSDSSLDNK